MNERRKESTRDIKFRNQNLDQVEERKTDWKPARPHASGVSAAELIRFLAVVAKRRRLAKAAEYNGLGASAPGRPGIPAADWNHVIIDEEVSCQQRRITSIAG